MPKAWVVRELGSPDGLRFEDIDSSYRLDGLVRIRVQASAVNFFDLLQIAGLYQVKPDLPFVPGAEVAGEVEAAPGGSGDRRNQYLEVSYQRFSDQARRHKASPSI